MAKNLILSIIAIIICAGLIMLGWNAFGAAFLGFAAMTYQNALGLTVLFFVGYVFWFICKGEDKDVYHFHYHNSTEELKNDQGRTN